MATNVVGTTNYNMGSRTGWGAIFGGTFVYLAIMATFGALGAAIFASVTNAAGLKVWMVVLAIISLYFAGRTAGHLANADDRNIGLYHGLITFGMCVFTTILILGMAFLTAAPYARTATTNTSVSYDLVRVGSQGGWGLFVALILGFIAAMIGGAHAAPKAIKRGDERPDLRRVA